MEEAQTVLEPPLRCRLCLHCVEDSDSISERLMDAFLPSGDTDSVLADKICDCLGIYLNSEDTSRGVCRNCEQTVILIDEFRILCRQTDEIYQSVHVRMKDPGEREQYHDYVVGLRKLIQKHRGLVNDTLSEAQLPGTECVTDGLSNYFLSIVVKEEGEEIKPNAPVANINVLDIKEEASDTELEREHMGFVDNLVDEREDCSTQQKDTNEFKDQELFLFRLQFANELRARLAQLKEGNSGEWKAVGKKFGMSLADTKHAWMLLRNLYRPLKKRAQQGSKVSISRCRTCPLFALLNELIPALHGDQPWVDPQGDTCEVQNEVDIPIDLKLVIAENIKQHPELWDASLASSKRTVDAIWKRTAQKFSMDVQTIRGQWHRLQQLYYLHHANDDKKSSPTDKQRKKLLEVLHVMLGRRVLPGTGQVSGHAEMTETEDGKLFEQKSRRIALAKTIYKHQMIWSNTHPEFHNNDLRDHIWDKIASEFSTDRSKVKREWKNLRDWYRSRYLRVMKGQSDETHLDDPLYKTLEVMLDMNMRVGCRGGAKEAVRKAKKTVRTDVREEVVDSDNTKSQQNSLAGDAKVEDEEDQAEGKIFETRERKIELADTVFEHRILWSQSDPDFFNMDIKDTVWDEVGAKFNIDRKEIKREWKRLRDWYRSRYLRVIKSELGENDTVGLTTDPLYQALDKMLNANMRIGSRGGKVVKKDDKEIDLRSDEDEQQSSNNRFVIKDRLKLAKICHENEVIWNVEHPNYNTPYARDVAWELIAAQFNTTALVVKKEWRRLRGIYRCRYLSLLKRKGRRNETTKKEPLYEILEKMMSGIVHVGKRGAASEYLGNPKPKPEVRHFSSHQERLQLAEEIAKHETIWNMMHSDYSKRDKRSAIWKQIGAKFGVAPYVVSATWKRAVYRSRKFKANPVMLKYLISKDPLYELVNQTLPKKPTWKYDTTSNSLDKTNDYGEQDEGECSYDAKDAEASGELWPPKRRFTGKRRYDDAGCIRVERNGTVRYDKVCELCGKQVERSYFEFHMNSHYGIRPYMCSVGGCGKRYGNRITRDRHEILVHGEDGYKFECEQCGEKFKHRSKYEYHYAVKHKSQEVPCPICGKLMKHKTVLQNHMRIHNGNHVCTVCGKVLQKKYSLDVHMRTHTQEKPYPCELCDQRFMLKVQMKTHLSKVHGISWEEFQANT